MTDLSPLVADAASLLALCRDRQLTIATAESCTGGLVVGLLTEVPGSSAVVDRGFVSYSNAGKAEMLGVPAALIERVGAVSQEVAIAMAEGALAHSQADLVVSITGIAGPGGGSVEKPVGLVHFAAMRRAGEVRHLKRAFGDRGRSEIRLAATRQAVAMLLELALAGGQVA